MERKKPILLRFFVAFTVLQIISYFLNSDQYLQLSGMYIFLFGAIAVGAVFCFLKIFKTPLNMYHFVILMLFVCMLISIIANISANERGYVLSYILLIFMTLLFSFLELDEKDLKKIYIAYIILSVVISVLIIVFQKRFYAEESNRLTIQIGENPFIDPNYLGACMVGPAFLSLQMAIEDKGRKLFKWLITALICVGIFLTGSRGALVALAVGVFVILCPKVLKRLNLKRILIILGVIIAAVIVALSIIPAEYLERMLDINNWMDSSNMRRLALWENAVDMIIKRPLLGYGLGNTATNLGSSAHNTYLEICAHIGMVGGLLFIATLLVLIFKKGNIYMKALAASTATWAIFISSETTLYLWLNISLCIAVDVLEKKRRKEECIKPSV